MLRVKTLPCGQLSLHPRAVSLFDLWASLAGLQFRGMAIRAVMSGPNILAFAGLSCLPGATGMLTVIIEDGLEDAEIHAAVLEEVQDLIRFLAAPPRIRQDFARAFIQNGSPEMLHLAGLDEHRPLPDLARKLHAPLRKFGSDSDKVIDRLLAQLDKQEGDGNAHR
ncbi:hypothetical protein D2T31_19665 [Sinirhodobacter populi]|uniref:Uncharacterized protein n=1 Tax=Paenirhodobacter populi TaxID=2306993 RepID=A0A443K186_9RHOB|nr:hypothetical protein [Sinirhodobacter populi]RWR26514.1 hypothetical protein D2T31_19665 [Sinirhodobacter populi]